ncbi:MAG TPA: hypothetical protein VHC22_08750 [Pirellulales bacterium]|nr:hypothetical protein [Pirellulales bacterium]
MYATFLQTVTLGKMLRPAIFGAAAIVLSIHWSAPLTAQEADGDFEGEKTWTDKAGKTHDIKPESPKDNKTRQIINKLRNEGKFSADADEEIFENWAANKVRPLTWKENITTLPAVRKELKKQLIQFGKSPVQDLHNRLNTLALEICSAVAKDPRYPRAVRINCTLMLADLDERENNAGASQEAVVMPGATGALVDMVADVKQPAFIRLEALIALMRHVKLGMAQPQQAKAVEALMTTMQTPISEGKDIQGQAWIRLRASSLLLSMIDAKMPVEQPAFASALGTLIADEKLPSWTRAALAGDLGTLDGKSLPADKAGSTVRSLAALMLTLSQSSPFVPEEPADEEAAADDSKKDADKKSTEKKDPKKDGKGAEAEKSEEEAVAASEEISPAAQRLLSEQMMWQLAKIRRALYGKDAAGGKDGGLDSLHGLHVVANDTEKANITKIVKHIDSVVKSLAEVPEGLQKLADTLRSANEDLEDLVGAPAAEQATAQAPKGGSPRSGPPAGNAPAEASAVKNGQ